MTIGVKTGGRKKGTPNKSTKALKDAILLAAEAEGMDGRGTDGLLGYLRRVAQEDIKAYSALLGRVLPLQVNADVTHREDPIKDLLLDVSENGKRLGGLHSQH